MSDGDSSLHITTVDDSLKNTLKVLVGEVFSFNQNYAEFIKVYKQKHIKKSFHDFRDPFILSEKDIRAFEACIVERLNRKYNSDYSVNFYCTAEYKNNDKSLYSSIDELFASSHEKPMLSIVLDWEYTVQEIVNDVVLPINYDIIVNYEVEQNTEQPERYLTEEYGLIHVEGCVDDWNSGTLKELKVLTETTKMPFWWLYPKKYLILMREYLNLWIWFGCLAFCLAFLAPYILNNNTEYKKYSDEVDAIATQRELIVEEERSDFIKRSREILDPAEKLQAYIERNLTPLDLPSYPEAPDIKTNWFLYYFVVLIVGGTVSIVVTKSSRYIFPKSMILIGSYKTKEKQKYIAYTFVWGAVICSIIGWVISMF